MTHRPAAVDGRDEVENPVDAGVPDALLLPLVEVAADVLRELEAVDVPSSLRQLHGFDRRGLLAGPGPCQLRRALVHDVTFAERVGRALRRPARSRGRARRMVGRDRVDHVADAVARETWRCSRSALWAGGHPGTRSASASRSCSTPSCAIVSARPTRRNQNGRNALRSKRRGGGPTRRGSKQRRPRTRFEKELHKERTSRRTA